MEIRKRILEIQNKLTPTKEDIIKLKDNLNGQNFLRKKYSISKKTKKKPKKIEIIVSEHAIKRWNERVGPISTNQEIAELIKKLIELHRVNFLGEDYGYIDNDILFIYEWTNEKEITVVTFYGRVSMNISLQSFTTLRKYNKNNLEQLNLELTENEISNQTFPIFPEKIINFYVERKRYEFNYFKTKEERLVIFIEQGEGIHIVQLLYENELSEALKEYPDIEKCLKFL